MQHTGCSLIGIRLATTQRIHPVKLRLTDGEIASEVARSFLAPLSPQTSQCWFCWCSLSGTIHTAKIKIAHYWVYCFCILLCPVLSVSDTVQILLSCWRPSCNLFCRQQQVDHREQLTLACTEFPQMHCKPLAVHNLLVLMLCRSSTFIHTSWCQTAQQ